MFLAALLLGAVVGVCYDVFRVGRRAFRHSWLLVLLEDLLFFLLCTLLVFRYFMERGGGEVRFFVFAGLLLGWTLYYFSIGRMVMAASNWMIDLFGKIWRAITVPIRKMAALLKKACDWVLKPLVLQKNRLKSQVRILYNRCSIKPRPRGKDSTGKGGSAKCRQQRKKRKKKNIPPSTC